MSFIKNLQKKINRVTEGYFANWIPGSPISVGDYGCIGGYRFTRDGNVGRYITDIKIQSARSETATFEKRDGLIVQAGGSAEGNSAIGKAKFSLKFGSEGSFLYHLKDLTNYQFMERREEFEKLGRLILSGKIKWNDDYVLVTEVKEAGKALVLVADSANAEMEIECFSEDTAVTNLASVVGGINYTRGSDRVVTYEIQQNAPLLFRVAGFTEIPPDGGPNGPVSRAMSRLRSWFGDKLPEPDSIYLSDYVASENVAKGEFRMPNDETIKLCQRVESIESFIESSERRDTHDDNPSIEQIELGKNQMYM